MNATALILITLLLSAFFSGMEIAFISSNRLRIELDRKQNRFSSKIVSIFIKNPSKYLTTMLVGNNIALVIYGIVMANLLEPYLRIYITKEILILTIQTLISTFFILVTAEFLPKTIFRNIANISLNVMALPILFFYLLFYPITHVVSLFTHIILLGIRNGGNLQERTQKVFNKMDLLYFINQVKTSDESEEDKSDEFKLFQNALDFSSVKVRDCMVPRTEIVALEEGVSIEELKKIFIDTGFSKILIYKDNIDNIIGYMTSKSLFESKKDKKLRIIDVSFVPEAMSANKLLKKLIQDKKSIAVVVDEFGGVSGMLTIEDIIEEIFGEIEDEHDSSELIEKKISETEYIFSGRLEIDYINELHHLELPESEEYETLAGFIINHYESIPKLNERIIIEQFEIKILKASSTKIELIHLKINND